MILRLSSSIKLQIKNCFLRGDTIYWQRKVPKDLEDRYSGSKLIKVNLKTNDLSRASKQVKRLNRQYEASWDAMRGNSALTPATVKGTSKSSYRRDFAPIRQSRHNDILVFLQQRQLVVCVSQPNSQRLGQL